MKCDICRREAACQSIGANDIYEAVFTNGFNPFKENLVPGAPQNAATYNRWKGIIAQDRSDSSICADCMKTLSRYLVGPPSPKGIHHSDVRLDQAGLDEARHEAEYWDSQGVSKEIRDHARSSAEQLARELGFSSQQQQSSRCFVATAVCGYDSTEVRVLQAFRDRILLHSTHGRFIVSVYYRIGPTLAKYLRHHPCARFFVRRLLIVPAASALTRILRLR